MESEVTRHVFQKANLGIERVRMGKTEGKEAN